MEDSGSLLTVLHVEDEDVSAMSVEAMLRNDPRIVLHRVKTLSEALERMKNATYSLILLDLMLSDSEGIGTFERVYAATKSPIVVLTAGSEKFTVQMAIQHGAYDYLIKGSFTGPQLLEAVRKARGIDRRVRGMAVVSNKQVDLSFEMAEMRRSLRSLHRRLKNMDDVLRLGNGHSIMTRLVVLEKQRWTAKEKTWNWAATIGAVLLAIALLLIKLLGGH